MTWYGRTKMWHKEVLFELVASFLLLSSQQIQPYNIMNLFIFSFLTKIHPVTKMKACKKYEVPLLFSANSALQHRKLIPFSFPCRKNLVKQIECDSILMPRFLKQIQPYQNQEFIPFLFSDQILWLHKMKALLEYVVSYSCVLFSNI